MGKKKVKRGRVGLLWQRLTALPGEEPIIEKKKKAASKKARKPKIPVKDLKAAAESINSVAGSFSPKKKNMDPDEQDIDNELHPEFEEVIQKLNAHTSKWKESGDTGLFLPPKVSVKQKLFSAWTDYKAKHDNPNKWVSMDKLPNKPNKFLLAKQRISKLFEKKKEVKKENLDEVFSEVEKRVEKVQVKDHKDIENIYKQLSDE